MMKMEPVPFYEIQASGLSSDFIIKNHLHSCLGPVLSWESRMAKKKFKYINVLEREAPDGRKDIADNTEPSIDVLVR